MTGQKKGGNALPDHPKGFQRDRASIANLAILTTIINELEVAPGGDDDH
jgi:hypothetical protein